MNEIIDNAINPHKNILFINTKEIEPYDVSYENFAQSKNQNVKNKLLMHNVFQRTNEFMTLKKNSTDMKQLNNEKKIIVDDILYQNIKNPTNHFIFFLISGAGTRKMFTLVCII